MRLTVKLGGSILEQSEIRRSILSQISSLTSEGHEIILVHGGGKSLSRRLEQMGMSTQFIDGLRVTDGETIRVALMVLAGEVNKSLVTEIGQLGSKALGICGADASSVRCTALSDLPGSPQGLGFVGKPVSIDRSFFDLILNAGLVPVVSSIAVGLDSQVYNVNADQMAAICAWGTGCPLLVYLTDVPGIKDEKGVVQNEIGKAEIAMLRANGAVSEGMLPKTGSCLEALEHGVGAVYILPGASPHVLRRLVDGTLREGTRIYENN